MSIFTVHFFLICDFFPFQKGLIEVVENKFCYENNNIPYFYLNSNLLSDLQYKLSDF